ncbi:MAG: ribosome maturation factor RimM, partial [Pseudomonadota bacterium]
VFSYTEPREALLNYDGWLLGRKGSWEAASVAEGQRHGKSVIAHLDGVDDREQAEALRGTEIGVARDALPTPGVDQFYWLDLEGLKVVHRDGTELGQIDHLLETGANDVMVVKGSRDEGEVLIPFVMHDVVLDVNLQDGKVTVDWEWD